MREMGWLICCRCFWRACLHASLLRLLGAGWDMRGGCWIFRGWVQGVLAGEPALAELLTCWLKLALEEQSEVVGSKCA